MATSKTGLTQLLNAPETELSNFDLIYVKEHNFPIVRKKRGRGFMYDYKGRKLKNKAELERIKGLVIPPMWKDVRITDLKEGHLQAVGRDDKKRKQYRYHPKWIKIRNQTKFYKMASFGAQLPFIREQVDLDLDKKGWPKSKIIALVIRLMEETHIRIGNQQYAKRNKTYGLSTLRKRHVKVHSDKLKFQFIGKKGKEHSVTIRNKKLIRLVSRCEEIPGWELFNYFDDQGARQVVDSSMINEYLQAVSHHFFTAKDFRTWGASVIFFETLLGFEYTERNDLLREHILTGLDNAAKALGNTRNVCRKYYVHPMLITAYEDGTLRNYFKELDERPNNNPYFTDAESAMLQFINNYIPDFYKQKST